LPNKNALPAAAPNESILTEAQIAELQLQVPEWQVKEVNGTKRLGRVFKFKNFAQGLEFTNKVGAAKGQS
jgi:4a-hydroxytetrahydrobiopterin dehydratase